MMNPTELSIIRTKLRDVNVEYSSLVRAKAGEGRFVRMHELKAERHALMALLAGQRGPDKAPRLSIWQPFDTAMQNAT